MSKHNNEHQMINLLTAIVNELSNINKGIKLMSKEFDDLQAQVAANSSALDSAVALINGIAARIAAAGVDPAKLSALTAELKAKDDVLAAAVLANTPTAI